MITDRFQRLRELEEKATPGPWRSEFNDSSDEYVISAGNGCVASISDYGDEQPNNAALIAESRNALPALLNSHECLAVALDWIEQRATTEKDGLLVERLQKTIDNGTIK